MDKNIKYLIEEIVNFNPVDYSDEDSDLIDIGAITNITHKYHPNTKDELIDVIQQCINENKFGNKDMYFPDLSNIDVSNITDMSSLFEEALRLIEEPIKLDLSKWYVGDVTNMNSMFGGC